MDHQRDKEEAAAALEQERQRTRAAVEQVSWVGQGAGGWIGSAPTAGICFCAGFVRVMVRIVIRVRARLKEYSPCNPHPHPRAGTEEKPDGDRVVGG